MQQTMLRINKPATPDLWPERFRDIVAAQNNLAPALFGRDDAGRTVANPVVRFLGGRTWVGLVADERHEDVLLSGMPTVLNAVSGHFGRPLPVQVERHDVALVPSSSPRWYRARNVALKRREPRSRASDLADLLTRRITASLTRQADFLGIDCPHADDLGVSNVAFERHLGMRLTTQHGPTAEFVTLVPSVTFSCFAELRGFWFVGNLSARGHGLVSRGQSMARAAA